MASKDPINGESDLELQIIQDHLKPKDKTEHPRPPTSNVSKSKTHKQTSRHETESPRSKRYNKPDQSTSSTQFRFLLRQ